ncbi:hypothetical protein XAC3810_710001 [Xanthomonas citri pv. citri]|nr:hypothetical protein XAC9322_670001 [Xanthomonas citri pv. citri]CEE38206.1 hypothetical protein XAC1083_700001 [Xanthomonas citri pv. citri]CEE46382.1 hypothetical protein XAC3810_710001 [Xanthomonas citri pv. citri]CEE74746.1 hypothetical protein XACW160_690001 [Xanthomonas citri pv. citri]CEE79559.1 hypothetical protein XAC2852_770001 [Xanthomonas citri pv. citri]
MLTVVISGVKFLTESEEKCAFDRTYACFY